MTLLPFSICASDFEYNGFYYTVLSYSDKTLELSANINSSGDEVVIPSIITYGNIDFTVISIGKYAFTGCDYKSIIIPTSITAINEFAFSGSGIETFSWPSNIETMNCGMFYDCRNLKTVVLPPTLKKIYGNNSFGYSGVDKKGAFEKCSSLEDIILPESLEVLDGSTFYGCESLKTINIPSKIKQIHEGTFCSTGLESITIPKQIEYIYSQAFDFCPYLKEVVIDKESELKSIGYWAFRQSSFTHIDLPVDLEAIYKFERLESEQNALPRTLKSITLPNNKLTIINGDYRVHNLEKIYSRNMNPEPISIDDFNINTVLFGTLYVPIGTISKYKETEGWKDFSNIQECDGNTNIDNISLQDNKIKSVYSINGAKRKVRKKGLNIIQNSDGSVKKVVVK